MSAIEADVRVEEGAVESSVSVLGTRLEELQKGIRAGCMLKMMDFNSK